MSKLCTIVLIAVFAAQPALVAGAGRCDHCSDGWHTTGATNGVSSITLEVVGVDAARHFCCEHERSAPAREPTDNQPNDGPLPCPLNCCAHSTASAFLLTSTDRLIISDIDLGLAGGDVRHYCPGPALPLLVPPPQFVVSA